MFKLIVRAFEKTGKQKYLMLRVFLVFYGILVFCQSSYSQEYQPFIHNTQENASATKAPDSLAALTPPKSSTLEGPVHYWAKHISFSIKDQSTHLEGDAKIKYQDIDLTAAQIDIDWEKNYLVAYGIADSTDSLGNPVYRGKPVLKEKGEEPITGIRLEFDFNNHRGKVLEGRTKMTTGYYQGKDIRKIGEETLVIKDGYFTTCDLEEHPHFYFRSSQMRIRLKKQATAKPVVLYIADVPIFIVPYAAFSLKRGRRSGIILPTYGENSNGGRFLQNFGYYWAPSDHWDVTAQATFYEKTGLLYNGDFRYRKRYAFDGNISGNYSRKDIVTGSQRERWSLNFRHSQKIGQTLTINGSGSFFSDKSFLRDYSSDFSERTNQNIRTSASIKKTLPGSRTLSINMTREENLQTERIDYTFPDLSFSQPSRSLFPRSAGSKTRWFNNIRYRYSSNLISRGSRIPVTDANGNITRFDRTSKSGWKHNIAPTFSAKLFKYFNFTPSISFEEVWVPEYLNYKFVDSLNTTIADTVKNFRTRHLFSGVGVSANTTFYGLFQIPFSPLKIIRHKVDPSISFSYRPDFSDPGFGYYQSFTDTTGSIIRRDRFANNPFGGTPKGKLQSIGIRLNNLFQGKLFSREKEKKIDLFYINFNTSHNFAADSLKWSNIRTTFQSKLHKNLTVNFNALHSFYKANRKGTGRRNEFAWSDGFALPNLLSWRTSMSYRLNLSASDENKDSDTAKKEKALEDSLTLSLLETDVTNNQTSSRLSGDEFQEFQGFKIPWNVNMFFNYSYIDNGNAIIKRFDVSINARVSLTKNWNISYNSQINIMEKEIGHQGFSISRDLHCWQLDFQWSPDRTFSFYRLNIRVKDSLLKDLKLTKSSRVGRPF